MTALAGNFQAQGLYVLIHEKGTLNEQTFYTESPEERGKGTGHRLLRIFHTADEASRYRDALKAYVFPPFFRLKLVTMDQVLSAVGGEPIEIQVCSMNEGEWPKTLETLWDGTQPLSPYLN